VRSRLYAQAVQLVLKAELASNKSIERQADARMVTSRLFDAVRNIRMKKDQIADIRFEEQTPGTVFDAARFLCRV
jgi:hypothetical protein